MRKKLTRTTLQRHIKDWTRKVRRGASSVIVGVLIEASILHVGMKEVSGISETKKEDIMDVMSTAMRGTKHERKLRLCI